MTEFKPHHRLATNEKLLEILNNESDFACTEVF
jgi:hypothetical protein